MIKSPFDDGISLVSGFNHKTLYKRRLFLTSKSMCLDHSSLEERDRQKLCPFDIFIRKDASHLKKKHERVVKNEK